MQPDHKARKGTRDLREIRDKQAKQVQRETRVILDKPAKPDKRDRLAKQDLRVTPVPQAPLEQDLLGPTEKQGPLVKQV